MKDITVILDAGHGGILNGEYQTAGKRSPIWSDGSHLYEGVFNRKVVSRLTYILSFSGIKTKVVSDYFVDTKLSSRVAEANKVTGSSFLLSIHANAGGGSGVEIYTSPGKTKADKYATIMMDRIKKDLPEAKIRSDFSDGDIDKEANFTILTKTKMPAMLLELFFMDNEFECKHYLMNDGFIDKIVMVVANGIMDIIEEIDK